MMKVALDEQITLGVNHQFLYIGAMSGADEHARTLALLLDDPRVQALDCWVSASRSREEIAALRRSNKLVHYNIGDRCGEPPLFPVCADAAIRLRTLDTYRREFDFALESGARKIIIGSGPDIPNARGEAMKRLEEFVITLLTWLPREIALTIEPTDRDIDKKFLLGPIAETNALIARVRAAGYENFGLLLDMSHIPILHETIEAAVEQSAPYLMHMHLGNAVIREKSHPLYGDKHPAWCDPAGEYGEAEVRRMVESLRKIGYIGYGKRPTLSFEMRVRPGDTPDESLDWFISALEAALV